MLQRFIELNINGTLRTVMEAGTLQKEMDFLLLKPYFLFEEQLVVIDPSSGNTSVKLNLFPLIFRK